MDSESVPESEPPSAVLSFMEPLEELTGYIVTRFRQFTHFFASEDPARRWTAKNPGTVTVPDSIDEGFRLGKMGNREQFKEDQEIPPG